MGGSHNTSPVSAPILSLSLAPNLHVLTDLETSKLLLGFYGGFVSPGLPSAPVLLCTYYGLTFHSVKFYLQRVRELMCEQRTKG